MLFPRIALATALLALTACAQNDTDITKHVQARLTADGIADQVHVSTNDRIVRLEGVVPTQTELNRAEMDARHEPGVLAVDNRLVVQAPVNLTGAAAPSPSAR